MEIIENYNSAMQKYGSDIVKTLSELGLPPQFLLSACRFIQDVGISPQQLVQLFKEWMRYVLKYNKNADVNSLSYEQFFKLIGQEKSKHCVPNVIYCDDEGTLGKLNNAKDVQTIPVKNQWCINSQKWFDNYTSKGYVFFIIYLPKEPSPFTYVVAAIANGDVEYYDTQDYEQFEDLRGGNENNSDHEMYQSKLPQQIVAYLYNIAANQTEQLEHNKENINCNKNMNKNRIRLTESQLHKLIKESVKKVLNGIEEEYKLAKLPNLMNRPMDRINAYPEYVEDWYEEEPICPIPNKERLHTLDRTTEGIWDGSWQTYGKNTQCGKDEVYPSAEWAYREFWDENGKPHHYSDWAKDADHELEKMNRKRIEDELKKTRQNKKDIEKYSKMADSRPLHRRNSLNRN